jgi:hypothetical protein
MGFFKKIFKPVSKVLDKIIPNEIKPALPYLAAFAPMFGPTSALMGKGIMQRALISGGLNVAGQLSQEGNEGDINLLSAGLGALSGAMTTPEFGTKIDSLRGLGGAPGDAPVGIFGGNKYVDKGLMYLDKGADFMQAPGLTKYGIPAAQGTGDLMFAQAKRDQDEYDDMMAAEADAEYASDASRALAIRQSMESYGFTEQEILDAIEAAGYKAGGRVGLRFGGIGEAIENIEDTEIKESAKFASSMGDMDIPMMDLVEEFEIIFKRKPNSLDEIKQFYKDFYEYKGPGDDVKIKEKIKETMVMKAKDGGRIGLQEGGVSTQILPQATQITAISQRPSLGSFQPLQQAQAVFPRLNELEQGVNIAENKLTSIRDRLGNEPGTLAGMAFQRPLGLRPALQPLNMLNLNRLTGISALQSEPVTQGMKDGGLMNLGGKEMDLRGGGFVPIGKKEKADDVPARLSKNEFVMTADAVRAAGGGSVNKGAKRMYDVMNKLEARA